MKAQFGQVKAGSAALTIMLADARSARNRTTREARSAAADDAASGRRYKQARAKEDRDRARAMNRRIRVQVADTARPGLRGRTPHKLFYRLGDQAMGSRITSGDGGGGTGKGTRAIHFAVTARGFASRTGRAWRSGEGERAALYIVREDALEGGEVGWWSNIAEDRVELVAFHRASEAIEQHDRANANVYVSEVIALPADLSARQRRKTVRRYCRHFETRGLPYTVAMHKPDPTGNGRNYHCHIVYSLRPTRRLAPYDWSFATSKCADVNTPAGILARRKLVVDAINGTLKAAGSGQRYTDLSNRARGLGAPSAKQGQKQTWALRRAAAAEVRVAALARLQAATTTLRAGLALLARLEVARVDITGRLRDVQEGSTAALPDCDKRLAALRSRVRDGFSRERTLKTATEPDARVTAAKRNVVAALARAMAGFTGPDAFATRIAAVAAAHARLKGRHRDDAEALTAAARKLAAAPPPDLEPWRTAVIGRLLTSHTDLLRPLPDLTPTRAAVYGRLGVAARIGATHEADRQRIIDLAPARRPDDRRQVDPPTMVHNLPAASPSAAGTAPEHTRSARPASPTAAMRGEEMAGGATNAPVTLPASSGGTAGDDHALIAANWEDEARLKRIAAAREAARIADIRERAFARLAAPDVRIRLADNGKYRMPAGILDAEERAALQHADYHAETYARLTDLYAAQRTVDARGAAPGSAPPPSPDAPLAAPTLAPAATSMPASIPAPSQDDDLAVLQAAKDMQDARKGR